MPRTIIRIGAAHYDVTHTTDEGVTESYDLSQKYHYGRGNQPYRDGNLMTTIGKSLCILHGIKAAPKKRVANREPKVATPKLRHHPASQIASLLQMGMS